MRTSGILMHISSLPSRYGIGTFGKEAFNFIDFLKRAGQSYWQVLPMGPTGFGDSPYQSFSTFAGNPYFIDLEILTEQRLLTEDECAAEFWGCDALSVDFEAVYNARFKILRIAHERFLENIPVDFDKFCENEKFWLDGYALFMALKDKFGGSWQDWDQKLKFRIPSAVEKAENELRNEILFYKFLQYEFSSQWQKVKSHANENGIKIIGDLPIYVSADSADVWSSPEMFMLDEEFNPIEVAGCPPDGFAPDGQLWGNPIYNWEKLKADEYGWWVERMHHASKIFDIVRIDHFRGFEAYYCIPHGDPTAVNGQWRKGPGIELFNTINNKLGRREIIVEDLGFLTQEVHDLVAQTGYPGMKILQFAFDPNGDSEYLPHNYNRNCVVYTGTHDNDTIRGWCDTADEREVNFAKEYLRLDADEGYNWGMMKAAWASVADTAIVTMQDLLGLGSRGRMNTPATPCNNWRWRAKRGDFNGILADKINKYVKIYRR